MITFSSLVFSNGEPTNPETNPKLEFYTMMLCTHFSNIALSELETEYLFFNGDLDPTYPKYYPRVSCKDVTFQVSLKFLNANSSIFSLFLISVNRLTTNQIPR